MQLLRVSDGKRGHDNQSLGLAEALARVTKVRIITIERGVRKVPPPVDLVVGAGHGTHITLLRMARAHRARSVVLMRPTLPRWLFDLCIVPQHDGVSADAHTFISLGALNRIRPAAEKDYGQLLVLLGGPSRHFGWNDNALRTQLERIVERCDGRNVLLIASRRTPDSTLRSLGTVAGTKCVAFDAGDPDWLAHTLPSACTVWVTEDSISMAYEAASAGAEVGLLSLPARSSSGRAARAVSTLVDAGRATRFEDWQTRGMLAVADAPLAEADRTARAILERWPNLA